MTEASYTAWDGNLYEWPPPDGWYEAADGKWWPDGYGPSSEDVNGDGGRSEAQAPTIQPLAAVDPVPTSLSATGIEPADAAPAASDDHDDDDDDGFDDLPNIDDVFGGVNIFADDEDETDGPEAAGPDTGDGHQDRPADPDPDPGHGDHNALASADAGDHVDHTLPGGDLASAGAGEHDDHISAGDGDHQDPAAGGEDDHSVVATEPNGSAAPSTNVADILAGGSGADHPGGNGGVADPAPFDQEPTPSAAAGFDTTDDEADAGAYASADDGSGTTDSFSGGMLITDGPAAAGFTETEPPGGEPAMVPADGSAPAHGVPPTSDPGHHERQPAMADFHPPPSDGQAQAEEAFGDTLLVDEYSEAPAGGQLLDDETAGGPGDPGDGDEHYRRAAVDDGGSGPVWPLAVAGVCVAALVALLLAYVLFRGGGDDGDSAGAEPSDTTATGQGSLSQPYGLGTDVAVYYDADGAQHRWVVKVLSPVVDGTDQLAESRAGTTPEGDVLAVSRVRLTYQSGPAPGRVADLVFNSVGDSASVYDNETNGCANVEEVLPLDAELSPTEFLEGNLCWQVAADDLPALKLAVEAQPAEGRIHLVMSQS
ncbi:MAG: hypothetical protein AAFN30_02200 [Actinomycetota bacterium]